MPYIALERKENLTPGYIKLFDVEGRKVLLVQGEAGPYLVDNACPHAGSPLAGGRVVGNRLRCPNHGYIFDLETGNCARGSREGFGPLHKYQLGEDAETVGITTPG